MQRPLWKNLVTDYYFQISIFFFFWERGGDSATLIMIKKWQNSLIFTCGPYLVNLPMADSHSNLFSWTAPNITIERSSMIFIYKFQPTEELILSASSVQYITCMTVSFCTILDTKQKDLWWNWLTWLLDTREHNNIHQPRQMCRLPQHLLHVVSTIGSKKLLKFETYNSVIDSDYYNPRSTL